MSIINSVQFNCTYKPLLQYKLFLDAFRRPITWPLSTYSGFKLLQMLHQPTCWSPLFFPRSFNKILRWKKDGVLNISYLPLKYQFTFLHWYCYVEVWGSSTLPGGMLISSRNMAKWNLGDLNCGLNHKETSCCGVSIEYSEECKIPVV